MIPQHEAIRRSLMVVALCTQIYKLHSSSSSSSSSSIVVVVVVVVVVVIAIVVVLVAIIVSNTSSRLRVYLLFHLKAVATPEHTWIAG